MLNALDTSEIISTYVQAEQGSDLQSLHCSPSLLLIKDLFRSERDLRSFTSILYPQFITHMIFIIYTSHHKDLFVLHRKEGTFKDILLKAIMVFAKLQYQAIPIMVLRYYRLKEINNIGHL